MEVISLGKKSTALDASFTETKMLLDFWSLTFLFSWEDNFIICLFSLVHLNYFSVSLNNVCHFVLLAAPLVHSLTDLGLTLAPLWAPGSACLCLAVSPLWGVPVLGSPGLPAHVPLAEQPCSPCSPNAQVLDVDSHVAVFLKGVTSDIIRTWISSVILQGCQLCPACHFPCLICTLDCSCPRASLILVLFSCIF